MKWKLMKYSESIKLAGVLQHTAFNRFVLLLFEVSLIFKGTHSYYICIYYTNVFKFILFNMRLDIDMHVIIRGEIEKI